MLVVLDKGLGCEREDLVRPVSDENIFRSGLVEFRKRFPEFAELRIGIAA